MKAQLLLLVAMADASYVCRGRSAVCGPMSDGLSLRSVDACLAKANSTLVWQSDLCPSVGNATTVYCYGGGVACDFW